MTAQRDRLALKALAVILLGLASCNNAVPRSHSSSSEPLFLVCDREPSSLLGYMDANGQVRIAPQFSSAWKFSDGIALVQDEGGKFGFVDRTGKYVCPPEFDEAGPFSEEFAWVRKGKMIGGKRGFIDRRGNLPWGLRFDGTSDFAEGLAAVKIGKQWGYIDKQGNMVIRGNPDWNHDFFPPGAFSCGLAKVSRTNDEAYIDKSGRVVVSGFKNASRFSEGLGWVRRSDRTEAFVATNGCTSFECPVGWTFFPFSCGRSLGRRTTENTQGFRFCYLDNKGNIVIRGNWDEAYDFSEGLACIEQDGNAGFINTSGMTVIPPQYESPRDRGGYFFVDGLARVESAARREGYIDTQGQWIADFHLRAIRPALSN